MPAASPDLTSIQNTLAGALDKLIALSASTALDNADAGAARAGLLAFAKDLVRELEGGESQTLEASRDGEKRRQQRERDIAAHEQHEAQKRLRDEQHRAVHWPHDLSAEIAKRKGR